MFNVRARFPLIFFRSSSEKDMSPEVELRSDLAGTARQGVSVLMKRFQYRCAFAFLIATCAALGSCSSARSNSEKSKASDQDRYAAEAANFERTQSIEDALIEIESKRRDSERREEMTERSRQASSAGAPVAQSPAPTTNESHTQNPGSIESGSNPDTSVATASPASPTPTPKVVANPFVPIYLTRDELGRALYSRKASKANDPIEFYLFESAGSRRMALYLCKESSGAGYPDTDPNCRGAGNAQLLGYISSGRDNIQPLSEISTCSVSITGTSGALVVEYRAGNPAQVCAHGPAITSVYILGYAKLP